jgi:uncharacterized glyoxalase superfamily protein PhnB
MIGDVSTLNLTSASAVALSRVALRLKRTTRRLWTRAQVQLNLAATAPRSSLVGASVIPTVRYRDVPKAVVWLCRAFGMKVHRIVTDADGAARYAELTVGAGMLMVAPIEDTAFGRMMVQPDEIGGVETQVCYLCVADARAHAARAKAAGAVVIIDPDDEANKGRGYSCRDPEGHVWNFGVYDPWGKPPSAAPARRRAPLWAPLWTPHWTQGRVQKVMMALVLLAVAGTMLPELWPRPGASAGTTVTAAQALTPEKRAGKVDAQPGAPVAVVPVSLKADAPVGDEAGKVGDVLGDKAPTSTDDEASAGRAALEAAEKAAAEARAQLATTRGALAKAEREASSARTELEELQRAKLAAERAAAEVRAKLAALQKTAERARAEAAEERAKRLRATLKLRKSVYRVRPQPRTWCLELGGGSGKGRLSGFCRG